MELPSAMGVCSTAAAPRRGRRGRQSCRDGEKAHTLISEAVIMEKVCVCVCVCVQV